MTSYYESGGRLGKEGYSGPDAALTPVFGWTKWKLEETRMNLRVLRCIRSKFAYRRWRESDDTGGGSS
ncbi:hypothetical protein Hypma_005693 [Hypsizygus marmoreus]|uniref:Uncharacterized protein n=1 Tax=Hypsizygus marmoreus TaxID=39966 RepID=A0A369JXV2_HYPMA|nr:hypothetical protein Hypma_005693 [Hypsizygus marmoreus]